MPRRSQLVAVLFLAVTSLPFVSWGQLSSKARTVLPGTALMRPVDQHVASDGNGNTYTATEIDSSGNHGVVLTATNAGNVLWTKTLLNQNRRENPHVVIDGLGNIELFFEVSRTDGLGITRNINVFGYSTAGTQLYAWGIPAYNHDNGTFYDYNWLSQVLVDSGGYTYIVGTSAYKLNGAPDPNRQDLYVSRQTGRGWYWPRNFDAGAGEHGPSLDTGLGIKLNNDNDVVVYGWSKPAGSTPKIFETRFTYHFSGSNPDDFNQWSDDDFTEAQRRVSDVMVTSAIDSAGNTYLAEDGFSSDNRQTYKITKLDPAGNMVGTVVREPSSAGRDVISPRIVIDSLGTVAVVSQALSPSNLDDMMVSVRYFDSNLNFIRSNNGMRMELRGSNFEFIRTRLTNEVKAVRTDNNGYVHIVGRAFEPGDPDGTDSLVFKIRVTDLTQSGGFYYWLPWTRAFPSTYDEASGVAIGPDGNAHVAGTAMVLGAPVAYHGAQNSDEEWAWTQSYPVALSNASSGQCIDRAPDGNFYLGGYAHIGSSDDALLLKTDSSGNLLWTQTSDHFGWNDHNTSIFVEPVTGLVHLGGNILNGSGPSSGVLYLRYDSNGSQLLKVAFTGGASNGNWTWATTADQFGAAFLANDVERATYQSTAFAATRINSNSGALFAYEDQPGQDTARNSFVDNNGDVIFTGFLSSTTELFSPIFERFRLEGVAVADSYSTDEDTLLNVTAPGVMTNDGRTTEATAVLTANGSKGTASLNPDGSFSYTPNADANGTDTFKYRLVKPGLPSGPEATVTVLINPINDSPVAVADSVTTSKNTTVLVNVLANDTDVDGDALTTVSTGSPTHGSATVNGNGSITYTPIAGYFGSDSFSYTISDGHGGTSTGNVDVTVTNTAPTNNPPTAVNDTVSTANHHAVTVDVLANDSDPEGNVPLSVVSVTQPTNGIVTLNADKTVSYMPTGAFSGNDKFTYIVADSLGAVSSATVTISVAQNGKPIANADSTATVNPNAVTLNILSNDSDPDGDAIHIVSLSIPTSGSVVDNFDGTVTYTPAAGFKGKATFTYTIADNFGGTDSATVSVTVTLNANPIASADGVATPKGLPVTIDVLANDNDPNDPSGAALAIVSFTQPTNGTVTLAPGGRSLIYTPPNATYKGKPKFSYTISNGFGTDTATVTVTVG